MDKPKKLVPKKYRAFREYVNKTSADLQILFYVTNWTITLEFQEEVETSEHGGAKGTACAEIIIDEVYQNARIYAYKGLYELFEEGNLEEIEGYLVHEFTHLLTEPLSNLIEQYAPAALKEHNLAIVERQTEKIKQVFCHLKDHLLKKNKKVRLS